ncbi:serine-type D-Ala-D-Ala carboxypeptidase [Vibrio sp. JC009]|uniref:serine-type D-Ala-D-Ala carboxypeptidase n=1 Tax=Vibrio sp. JC009 TaxID=2912314 RepID=UPI0023AF16E4|nr:serine-type D-Ala-D-Ala carboxypeptidase [Vibrio sp. JC009]WED22421.1 serine-type D-Ala-D-Ala carboxypeptidase [Vibrio sp. JC009]
MRVFIAITAFLLTLSAQAYSPVDILPEGSRVGLSVHTPEGNPIEINSEQLFPPASTLKIVTALAAKLELGNEFRFATSVEADGDDMIIRFSGDPTLTSHDLAELLTAAKANGLKEIKGDIYLNKGTFSGYERGVGWPWDILGVCYSAPASAITLDENCVQASIYTNKDGTTRVHVPEHQPINVSTRATSVSKELQKERQCELELITFDNNRYELSGCLTYREKPLPLKFAVQETSLYTGEAIKHILSINGIKFSGKVKTTDNRQGTVLATNLSAPLPELIDKMLKESDNLIADNLVKTIGAKFYIQPGSFNNGTEAIKQIVYSHTGINLTTAQLADGSGLSRNNRMSVKSMTDILNYIWRNDNQLALLQLLPNSGESGTLKYRRSMRKEPVKGHLKAKSGSLYGSYNMAGYVLDDSGQPKATFVQFVTDYYPPKRDDNQKATTPAIFLFEKAFYTDLIKLSLKNSTKQTH